MAGPRPLFIGVTSVPDRHAVRLFGPVPALAACDARFLTALVALHVVRSGDSCELAVERHATDSLIVLSLSMHSQISQAAGLNPRLAYCSSQLPLNGADTLSIIRSLNPALSPSR